MKHEDNKCAGFGFGWCVGKVFGLFAGVGGGIYASTEVGKQIISAFPASSHTGATVLAVITGMAITGLAAVVGMFLFCCFCACFCGLCCPCVIQGDNGNEDRFAENSL